MWNAVILAGGRGSRLGGIDKSALVDAAGTSLLDRALAATEPAQAVVVVGRGNRGAAHAAGVHGCDEVPAFGGPVAAVAAGLTVLEGSPAEWTALLAADLPGVGSALPALLDALPSSGGPDAVITVDTAGRAQWLLGLYRTEALRRRLADAARDRPLAGASMRELLAQVPSLRVMLATKDCADVDTLEDAVAAGLVIPEPAHG